MKKIGHTIVVTIDELTRCDDGEAVMTRSCYDKLVSRKRLLPLRAGKGLGNCALIEYSSLPVRFRERFEAKYGDPDKILNPRGMELIKNADARRYFAGIDPDTYKLPSGESLKEQKQEEYVTNASVLDALLAAYNTQRVSRNKLGNSTPIAWDGILAMSEQLRDAYQHTLPANTARLKEKMRSYAADGFDSLVSKKFCNANTLKITEVVGRQIIALRRSRVPVYTVRQIFDEVNAMAEDRGWKPLRSVNALTQYLDRPEVKPLWYGAVYGELAERQLYARQHRTELPSMRDALWYGDGTKLNLYFRARNKDGKMAPCTVQVYEVIDAYSETLLGYHISPTENYTAQYRAYRMAAERAGHKPYEIVHDNQGGHGTTPVKKLLGSICRYARPTAPHSGQSKTIESLFGRFQKQVLAQDWRYTGGNMSSKQAWKVNREFLADNQDSLFTYDELVVAYAAAREQWNEMPHPATGISRRAMYEASVNAKAPAIDKLDMIDMFWTTTERSSVFTAAGIEIEVETRKYTYEVFDGAGMPDMAFRAHNTGRSFFTRYDPLDMSCVQLCTKDKGGTRVITEAKPYLKVHRAIQEQVEGERAFIVAMDTANKTERLRRQIAAKELEIEHGVAPEQHGLHSPKLRGISKREAERLSDQLMAASFATPPIDTEACEPIAVGAYEKMVSNMDYYDEAVINQF